MNLFLIGLPGSGKSTLGKQLAKLLSLTLVDTDALIVQKTGETIEAIFEKYGEPRFRQIEQEVLHELFAQDNQLISTGGGLPCYMDNMEQLSQNGTSIFIDVPVETLQKRLTSTQSQQRPMVKNKTEEEVLSFLKGKYQERLPFYSKANITVFGTNIKAQDIIDKLESKK